MTGEQPQRRDEPSGFRHSWRAHENFVMVPIEAIRTLGLTEATVLSRIEWRFQSHPTGYRASAKELAADVGVSERTIRDVTKRLRERGMLTSDRASSYDATPVWRVVYETDNARHLDTAENVTPLTVSAASEAAETVTSSSKTGDKNKTSHASADATEVRRLIQHHSDLVARWADKPPRVTVATDRVAERLITTHGYDVVVSLVSWAQADDFWRSNTRTLDKVSKHWDTLREKRRQQRGTGPHKPEVSAETRAHYAAEAAKVGWF